MQDGPVISGELPAALQWAAGILTVIAGTLSMLWAAKRWNVPQHSGLLSGQPINDPQFVQLITSGQALQLAELKEMNVTLDAGIAGQERMVQHLIEINNRLREVCADLERVESAVGRNGNALAQVFQALNMRRT